MFQHFHFSSCPFHRMLFPPFLFLPFQCSVFFQSHQNWFSWVKGTFGLVKPPPPPRCKQPCNRPHGQKHLKRPSNAFANSGPANTTQYQYIFLKFLFSESNIALFCIQVSNLNHTGKEAILHQLWKPWVLFPGTEAHTFPPEQNWENNRSLQLFVRAPRAVSAPCAPTQSPCPEPGAQLWPGPPGLADHPTAGPSWSQHGGWTLCVHAGPDVLALFFLPFFEVSKEEQLHPSRVSLFCGLSLFNFLVYGKATSCITTFTPFKYLECESVMTVPG